MSVMHILFLQAELMQLFVETCIYIVNYFITVYKFEQLQQQQCLALLKAPHVVCVPGWCLPAALKDSARDVCVALAAAPDTVLSSSVRLIINA